MSFGEYLCLQVGSGLSGQLNNSYALYNASLVDGCLQLPSPGCNRTIAFWLLVPDTFHHNILSTVRRHGNRNTTANVGNSGIVVAVTGDLLLVGVAGNQNTYYQIIPFSRANVGNWNHIAITYRGTTDFAVYFNFTSSNLEINDIPYSRVSAEPFMGTGILNGLGRRNETGFGTIDEVLVFPDVLSPEQIAQLNQTSN